MKKVMRQTTPGAINELRVSVMTVTHSYTTGPSARGLLIPKSGLKQTPEQSISSSNVLKKANPS